MAGKGQLPLLGRKDAQLEDIGDDVGLDRDSVGEVGCSPDGESGSNGKSPMGTFLR